MKIKTVSMQCFQRLDEANAVIIRMADRGLRVYYVSVEDNSKNQVGLL